MWQRITRRERIELAAAAVYRRETTVRPSVVSREKTEADNNIIVSWRCSAGCLKTNENYRKIRSRTTVAARVVVAVERIISISRPPSSRVYSPKTEKKPPAGSGAGWGGPARIINKNDRGPEKFFDRVRVGEMQHFCCSCTPVRGTATSSISYAPFTSDDDDNDDDVVKSVYDTRHTHTIPRIAPRTSPPTRDVNYKLSPHRQC